MNIIKISQNMEYLDKLGVPQNIQQDVLNYLLSIDKNTRKTILNKIRKNPTMNLEQIKKLNTNTKINYLKQQGYDDNIINIAIKTSPKYAIWLAREIKKYRNKISKKFKSNSDFKNLDNITPWSSLQVDTIPVHQDIRSIIDYIEQNNPDLMSMSYDAIEKLSYEWHEKLKEKQKEKPITYKTHNVVYKLNNGWEIVKLTAGDCEPEGNNMGHCVSGYAEEVANEKTEIFSLRDPNNNPHVTLEMNFYPTSSRNNEMRIEIQQIKGKNNKEPIPEYKTMIKEWFDHLKTKNYKFDAMEGYDVDIEDLSENLALEDDYGININVWGIGGHPDTYLKNIQEIERKGWHYNSYNLNTSINLFDALLEYAYKRDELKSLERATTIYTEYINDQLWDYETSINYENPEPDEPLIEDYILPSDIQQYKLNLNVDTKPKIDNKAYQEALEDYKIKQKAYEQEREWVEDSFEPLKFSNYMFKTIQEAVIKKEKENLSAYGRLYAKTTKNNKAYKTAESIKEEDIPKPNILATYVEALKTYLSDATNISEKISEQIKNLPSSGEIKRNYSFQECKLLFETVNYLWKAITKKDIVDESKIEKAPETLMGNYWMLKNGVLLKGSNHVTIIKQNTSMFCSLLNLNAFTLLQYLSTNPNKLIFYIIRNGGVRIFINKDKNAYFQMSEEIYAKWGRKKVKELDFPIRIVKILGFNHDYNGWDSGITVTL